MKKQLFLPFVISVLLLLAFSSCSGDDVIVENVNYIVGTWSRPSTLNPDSAEFYKYEADGFGRTWDTADDVTEAEAQEFTWTLEQDNSTNGNPYILTHIHIMEMGAEVPKVYEVTRLTTTQLVYVDDYGNQFSYTKVK